MTREQLYAAALELSEADRLELASTLMNSIAPESKIWFEDDEGFLDELDRRSQDGSATTSWEQVRAELHNT